MYEIHIIFHFLYAFHTFIFALMFILTDNHIVFLSLLRRRHDR